MAVVLEDSLDKLIQQMADCDKIPVEYMDLLTHRIRCRKIEIFHYDDEVSFTTDGGEEEQELSLDHLMTEDRTDDEDRTLKIVGEIDCLIRRIEHMQLAIKHRQDYVRGSDMSYPTTELESSSATPVPELGVFEFKECMPVKVKRVLSPYQQQLAANELPMDEPFHIVLNRMEELAVRNLQHAQHRLQCEIDELLCNYRLMRTLLGKMRRQICQENRRVRKLGVITQQYKEWSQEVVKDLPACKQNFAVMVQKKLCKHEGRCIIRAHKAKEAEFMRTLLSYRQLNYEIREFELEIKELQQYCNDLNREMVMRFDILEEEASETSETCEEVCDLTI
ncbi:uncharacterized protein LOC6585017 [Drosophila mojavensis]|uniref:Uncharacterized protein n=1 Tax=Drosophila mojavensis TaxID=7230 RepID=B4L553_DROMO|nr:uncharacterized protein LOC6585017 [Drosophila mojavensis]EDW06312.1 uncharacterized protein Dmoj_GI21587 [Drosophila mojavensis]